VEAQVLQEDALDDANDEDDLHPPQCDARARRRHGCAPWAQRQNAQARWVFKARALARAETPLLAVR
jgi:hypothetical protein